MYTFEFIICSFSHQFSGSCGTWW